MKNKVTLLLIILYFNNVAAQEKVFRTDYRAAYVYKNNVDEFYNKIFVYGNFNTNSSFFLVYTTAEIDLKYNNIIDSLTKFKVDYNLNRLIDLDSTKNNILDIQKNLKKSIDNIPQIITTTEVAKLLKAQIIKDLKETEISYLNIEIKDLKESIELLKLEIAELKKKKPNK